MRSNHAWKWDRVYTLPKGSTKLRQICIESPRLFCKVLERGQWEQWDRARPRVKRHWHTLDIGTHIHTHWHTCIRWRGCVTSNGTNQRTRTHGMRQGWRGPRTRVKGIPRHIVIWLRQEEKMLSSKEHNKGFTSRSSALLIAQGYWLKGHLGRGMGFDTRIKL
jgi:hypothetical protein